MSDTGGPAFPVVCPAHCEEVDDGMTLRDYFAAKAMQTLVANKETTYGQDASAAYAVADAMLAARAKPSN